jgi:hypothetical protein
MEGKEETLVRILVNGDDLVVRLLWWQKVAARRGNVRVPLAAVRRVTCEPDWWCAPVGPWCASNCGSRLTSVSSCSLCGTTPLPRHDGSDVLHRRSTHPPAGGRLFPSLRRHTFPEKNQRTEPSGPRGWWRS